MNLRLTPDQSAALTTLVGWMRAPDEPFAHALLTGYAGTGKTTLLRVVANAAERLGRRTVVLAPTGKAAVRVKEATKMDASTVHRFLYTPQQNTETGEVQFAPKGLDELEQFRGRLVAVDEASMLDERSWEHLRLAARALGLKLLIVGDPFQLEPVADGRFNALKLPAPHAARLAQVVRQALDSPVLRAATMVRAASGPVDVALALAELRPLTGRTEVDVAAGGVPVLVHRNVTRHKINAAVRSKLGLAPAGLVAGEPLLVLKNSYDLDLYNGETVRFEGWAGDPVEVATVDRRENVAATLRYGLGRVGGRAVVVCLDEVLGDTRGLGEFWLEVAARDAWRKGILKGRGEGVLPPFLHVNHGYVLTVHKAQGSEWDAVAVVFEPSVRLGETFGLRWCYTALTRARHEVLWRFDQCF